MSRLYLKYSFLFLVAIFCQAYLFGRINFMGGVNPQVFTLFILIVPLHDKAWLMLLGFALGFSVDLLMGTGGLHAASLVLIAFIRPLAIRLISRKEAYDSEEVHIATLSRSERFFYFAVLLSLQSLALYLLDGLHSYSLARIGLRALVSAALTWLLCTALYPFVKDPVRS